MVKEDVTGAIDIVGDRRWFDDVRRHALDSASRTAVLDLAADDGWTYGELWDLSGRIAEGLHRAGIGPGAAVLMYLTNSLWYPAMLLGIHRAGVVGVMAGPWCTVDELRYQMVDSICTAIVTDDALAESALAAAGEAQVFVVGGGDHPGSKPATRLIAGTSVDDSGVTPRTLASVLYTSGTTGRPKGAGFLNGNYTFHSDVSQHLYGYGPWDTGLNLFPLSLAHGHFYQLTTWLTAGVSMVIAPFTASGFPSQVLDHRITVTSLNATHMKMISERATPNPRAAASFRFVKMGLHLPIEESAQFESEYGGPLVRSYSQTETVGPVISWRPANRDLGSVGLPVLGYQLSIWDADEHPVADGAVGQLVVRSQHRYGLFHGYRNLPELTAAGFAGGWWRTGDLVTRRADAAFEFVGRIGDIIKRKGFSVAAAEVERVLAAHPDVGEVAVVGVVDPVFEEEIHGFVVPLQGRSPSPEDLLAHCAELLSEYKIPQVVEVVSELPRDRLGKVNKRALKAAASSDRTTSHQSP